MCGIAGIYLKNPDQTYLSPKELNDAVDWLFCGVEHRGKHATGMAVQSKTGETLLEKSDMPASKFIFWRRDVPEDARSILLHTRHYTKGKPENLLNNHPVQYKNILMTHNGHISNDDELFVQEELERFAEVDSEIISALLHKYSLLEPTKALELMEGGFAIAAIDEENPGKLLLAKGSSSPLMYLETSGMLIWASTKMAIEDAMKYGLSYEVKYTDVKELQYGEYMIVDGEEIVKDKFTPYFKAVISSNNYSGGRPINSPYTPSYYNQNQDQCDGCFKYFTKYLLNRIGKELFCDQCEKNRFSILVDGTRVPKATLASGNKSTKKLSRKERKRLRKEAQRKFQEATKPEEKKQDSSKVIDASTLEISEVLDDEHWFVCEMVADFFGTKSEFVDMILFSDDLFSEDDPMLSTIYREFEDKYQELLNEVRDDTDVVLKRISDRTENTRKFPAGFGGGI
jgi:predicted glutamine amidotransferase